MLKSMFEPPPQELNQSSASTFEDPAKTKPSMKTTPPSAKSFKGKRFNPRFTKGGTGGKVTHDKTPKTTGLQAVPIVRWFQIFVSNKGVETLCPSVWQGIQGRDAKMTTLVTLPQFKYVTTMAYIGRIVRIASDLGYIDGGLPEVGWLLRNTQNIQLPSPVVKYIDSIGQVTMSSGVTVVPWCAKTFEEWFPDPIQTEAQTEGEDGYIIQPPTMSPEVYLAEGRRPPVDNYWRCDISWINEWNQLTTRTARSGMGFGVVSREIIGKPEILITRTVVRKYPEELIQGFGPQAGPQAEFDIGAVYDWRRDYPADWLGGYTEILYGTFTGQIFSAEQELGDAVVAAFTARPLEHK